MHGIIFSELRKYAEAKQGSGAWSTLLKHAQLEHRIYLALNEYPDGEMVALVSAVSKMSGQPTTVVLEDFGEFIAPTLMNMYGHLIPGQWNIIDVIDQTEATIHSVVRANNPGAKPPTLRTIRRSKDEVVLIYSSPRKMCALAIGIARGLAKRFNQTIAVNQTRCMHTGAPHCEIVFRKVA